MEGKFGVAGVEVNFRRPPDSSAVAVTTATDEGSSKLCVVVVEVPGLIVPLGVSMAQFDTSWLFSSLR